jgi:hypothetical protein
MQNEASYDQKVENVGKGRFQGHIEPQNLVVFSFSNLEVLEIENICPLESYVPTIDFLEVIE